MMTEGCIAPMSLPQFSRSENEWFLREVYPHEPALKAWLKHRYPSLQQWDEIVQESYLKVLKVHRKFRLKAPKAYLFATARNLCIDALRREKVVKFHSMSCEQMEGQGMEMSGKDVRSELIEQEEFEILTSAIQTLPKQCRRVVTLRKVYGMSAKQIASELKLSHRTVENQLLIGMKRCREFYASLDRGLQGKRGEHKR